MPAWSCRKLTTRPRLTLFHLVLESHHGKGLCDDSGEKHEPASDIDAAVADSLKALDLNRSIREADIHCASNRSLLCDAMIPDPNHRRRCRLRWLFEKHLWFVLATEEFQRQPDKNAKMTPLLGPGVGPALRGWRGDPRRGIPPCAARHGPGRV